MADTVELVESAETITLMEACSDDPEVASFTTQLPPVCGCDKTFTFRQFDASAVWNVCHDLGKKANAVVTDNSGNTIPYTSLEYNGLDVVIVTFPAPVTGYVHLN